jgi:hypothetical protein
MPAVIIDARLDDNSVTFTVLLRDHSLPPPAEYPPTSWPRPPNIRQHHGPAQK